MSNSRDQNELPDVNDLLDVAPWLRSHTLSPPPYRGQKLSTNTTALLSPAGSLTPAPLSRTNDWKPRVSDLNLLGLRGGAPQRQPTPPLNTPAAAKLMDGVNPQDVAPWLRIHTLSPPPCRGQTLSPNTTALMSPAGNLTPAPLSRTKDGNPRVSDLNLLGLRGGVAQRQPMPPLNTSVASELIEGVNSQGESATTTGSSKLPSNGKPRHDRVSALQSTPALPREVAVWRDEQRQEIDDARVKVHDVYVNDARAAARASAFVPTQVQDSATGQPQLFSNNAYIGQTTIGLKIRQQLEEKERQQERQKVRQELFKPVPPQPFPPASPPLLKPRQPSYHPETHCIHLQTPSIHPQRPSIHPETPSIYSQTPSIHPQRPSIHPETPSIYSQTPIIHPQTPSIHPETPSIHPQTPNCHVEQLTEAELDEKRRQLLTKKSKGTKETSDGKAKKTKKRKKCKNGVSAPVVERHKLSKPIVKEISKPVVKELSEPVVQESGQSSFVPHIPTAPTKNKENAGGSYSKRKRRLVVKAPVGEFEDVTNADDEIAKGYTPNGIYADDKMAKDHCSQRVANSDDKITKGYALNVANCYDEISKGYASSMTSVGNQSNGRRHYGPESIWYKTEPDVSSTGVVMEASRPHPPLIPRQTSQQTMCWNSDTAKRGLGFRSKQRRDAEERFNTGSPWRESPQ